MSYTVQFVNKYINMNASIEVGEDELILSKALKAKLPLPHSCRSGACSACTAKLISGVVDQEDQSYLEPKHVDEGYVLLCCAYPLSDCVFETDHQESL